MSLFIIVVVCGGYPDRLHAAEGETAQATASLEAFQSVISRGHALYYQADYAGAATAYPNYADAHYDLGRALAAQGDWAGAEAAFREAIRVKPDDADYYFILGEALAQQGDLVGAVTAYREALRLNPRDQLAKMRLDALAKKEQAQADALAKKEQAQADALAKKEQAQALVDAVKKAMQQVATEQQAAASAAPPSNATPQSDVDSPPTAVAPSNAHAYAVVIGIEQYRQHLPSADFAKHDATIMAQYLEQRMGYAAENIVTLTNDQASLADLTKYAETWLPNQVDVDSSVFVYYSGHGAPDPKTGQAYLVPYDGDPAFLQSTGYAMNRLYAQLSQLPAKEITVVLDTCFSGAGGRSVIAQGIRPAVVTVEDPLLSSETIAVLAASQSHQVSSTHTKKSHGLLTYYFLKGLQGEADSNGDDRVELGEVFEYLKPQVERVARRAYNNEQTPQLIGAPAVQRLPLVHLAN